MALVQGFGDAANEATKKRVSESFLDFCRLNEQPGHNVYLLWAAQMHRCGLAWSTIHTYVNYVHDCVYGRPDHRHEAALYLQAKKLVGCAHADESSRFVATDTSIEELRVCLRATVPEHKAILWFCIATGTRVRDAMRLRRSQLTLGDRKLQVEFRLTKNRRVRALRRRVVFPLSWSCAPPPEVARYVRDGDGDVRLFGNWNAAAFNKELKSACLISEIPNKLTSYSVRRRFIDRVKKVFPDDDAKVLRFTLHLDSKMIHAHY